MLIIMMNLFEIEFVLVGIMYLVGDKSVLVLLVE